MLCEHEVVHIHQYFIVSEHAVMLYPVACAICGNIFIMGGKETVLYRRNLEDIKGSNKIK